MSKKKVIKHLRKDIKTFKKEAQEDRELIKELKGKTMHKKHKKHEAKESKKHERKEHAAGKKAARVLKKDIKKGKKEGKIQKVLHEFKEHSLHSGSKKGPLVKSRKQAIAIGLSEARKAGEAVAKKKKKK